MLRPENPVGAAAVLVEMPPLVESTAQRTRSWMDCRFLIIARWPDPAKEAKAGAEMEEMAVAAEMAQMPKGELPLWPE